MTEAWCLWEVDGLSLELVQGMKFVFGGNFGVGSKGSNRL